MRESFIIHLDSLTVLDELSDEEAGQLFRAIKAYNDGEQVTLNKYLKMAFIPFKNQFDRDKKRYDKICKRNQINGMKGGRPSEPKKPSGLSGNPNNPVGADSDSDSDSDSKKDYIDRARDFYKCEHKESGEDEKFGKFIDILFGDNESHEPLKRVLSIQAQVTWKQFQTLMQYRDQYKISLQELLIDLDNYDKIKKYKSVQKTLLSWIRQRSKVTA